MLLGVVLLYVGVVLIVNGIWLIGQARADRRRRGGRRGGRGAPDVHPEPRGRGPESLHRFRRRRRGCDADGPRQQPGGPRPGPRRGLHPAVRLHLSVGRGQQLPQRGRPRVRLVLPVRGDHRDPGRDLDVRDRAAATPRRSTSASAGLPGPCCGSCSSCCLRSTGRSAGSPGRWRSSRASATAWVFGILLLENQLAF